MSWPPEPDRVPSGLSGPGEPEDETGSPPQGGDPVVLPVSEGYRGHRLDYFLAQELGVSRAFATRLVRQGQVQVSWSPRVKPALKVEPEGRIQVVLPPEEELDLVPEEVPFEVVYEDRDLVVVDKPAGLVVHPAPGHWRGTLVHGLLFRFPEMEALNGVRRPGIVHRLDATTSGLLVVARNGRAMEELVRCFQQRRVQKEYLALVFGRPSPSEGRIDLPIGRDPLHRKRMAVVEGGRDSLTLYRTLWTRDGTSLVRCDLRTGRTHQIRVHLRALGCPLVGDRVYAPGRPTPFSPDRVFLHAWRLGFPHPRTGEPLSFRSPLPPDLLEVLAAPHPRASVPQERS